MMTTTPRGYRALGFTFQCKEKSPNSGVCLPRTDRDSVGVGCKISPMRVDFSYTHKLVRNRSRRPTSIAQPKRVVFSWEPYSNIVVWNNRLILYTAIPTRYAYTHISCHLKMARAPCRYQAYRTVLCYTNAIAFAP